MPSEGEIVQSQSKLSEIVSQANQNHCMIVKWLSAISWCYPADCWLQNLLTTKSILILALSRKSATICAFDKYSKVLLVFLHRGWYLHFDQRSASMKCGFIDFKSCMLLRTPAKCESFGLFIQQMYIIWRYQQISF